MTPSPIGEPAADCDHCGEEDATVDLGPLDYCQRCFDEAVDSYAESYGLKDAAPYPFLSPEESARWSR